MDAGFQGSDDALSNEVRLRFAATPPPPYSPHVHVSLCIPQVKAVQALGRYGLGTKRTLDQLIDFTGVDVRAGVVFKDRCADLACGAVGAVSIFLSMCLQL